MELVLDNFVNNLVFFCLLISVFLAYCGMMFGVKNLIRTLISMEVLFLCISFLFILVSINMNNLVGQIFALFILALAACESALGLSLLIFFFRTRGLLTSFELLSSLKG
jgi:NADH:ubiquinone oxidoreductase subunit K